MSTEEHAGCDTEAWAAVHAPSEAHARLEPFVGDFKAEVKMWMGPGEPMVSTGMMTNSMELGGRYLHQVYKGDATDGPFPNFQGRGYWGFNNIAQRYEGFWVDSVCTSFQIEHGQVDESGKVWTMLSEMPDPSTGRPVQKRSVITMHDADAHSMEMFTGAADGEWQKTMQIDYTRA